jgi:uncharacterized protein (TIGR03067 family)
MELIMYRCLTLAIGFVVLSSAFAAPALKEDKGDLKKLQGEWEIVTWEQHGRAIKMKATWAFDGEKYTLDQGSNLETGTIKIDQSKKLPTMDLDITGGNCAGKEQPGIYKLDGDTLTCCFAWPGETDRPTEFSTTAENRRVLVTLKRIKKDK